MRRKKRQLPLEKSMVILVASSYLYPVQRQWLKGTGLISAQSFNTAAYVTVCLWLAGSISSHWSFLNFSQRWSKLMLWVGKQETKVCLWHSIKDYIRSLGIRKEIFKTFILQRHTLKKATVSEGLSRWRDFSFYLLLCPKPVCANAEKSVKGKE